MSHSILFDQLRSGLCTFLGFPCVLDSRDVDPHVQGVILGAPFDGGVIHRPGARLGPWALRAASLGVGRIPMPLKMKDADRSRCQPIEAWVDGGNIPTLPFSNVEAIRTISQEVMIWAQKCRTLILGGDHLVTLGAVEAHARIHGPLGMLHLDAHPDSGDLFLWGGAPHHGNWLRIAIEQQLVDPRRTVQLGLRAPRHAPDELQFLENAGVSLWTPSDIREGGLAELLQKDVHRLGEGPAYVSLDLDVLDPAYCPAVAEPVPGGLSVLEVLRLLSMLKAWTVPWVGADVMELSPGLEGGESSARVGVHVALHLLDALNLE